ncbi:hypothetical protein [Pseudomonas aegrilactucae]|uniref:hypothetical protein n=1 Tax=Pseudomonas aegrilactucae TaxID=2854028 RepID=UPI0020D253AC|nr:hypothetical protein [Pseudomonas aegrilactucae]
MRQHALDNQPAQCALQSHAQLQRGQRRVGEADFQGVEFEGVCHAGISGGEWQVDHADVPVPGCRCLPLCGCDQSGI